VSFDSTNVYLLRGDLFYKFDAGDVINVNAGNNYFELKQSGSGGTTSIDGSSYKYERGDKIYCRMKGKDLGAYDDNIVEQARDILIEYGGVLVGDFDSTWDTFRDKAAPSESAVSTFKSRAWLGKPEEALKYALSMLEQVRLEAFIDRNLKFKISSLHFDDFVASPSFRVKNWDFEKNSFIPTLDDRNNFNRARGSFNFLPNRNENYEETRVYRNQDAIDQVSKEISKRIVFPNLYEQSVVVDQIKEILKLTSATIEVLDSSLTWRAMLLDVGDFVKINVDIQSTQYVDVPALIREIGYDPDGMKIPIKMWSFQMCPFPGYNPGYSGTVGGNTATIIEE
jgi:hypothetical protein